MKNLNRSQQKQLIFEHLPGRQEEPVSNNVLEDLTGIPSRKIAAIITTEMKHDTAEVIRMRKPRSTSKRNFYRRKI